LQLVDKAFCLSAAKKKEYEGFGLTRQPLLFKKIAQQALEFALILYTWHCFCFLQQWQKQKRKTVIATLPGRQGRFRLPA
jgi:hypothetical protein